MVWTADFWDGPINGLCLYDGSKYWFERLEEDHHEVGAPQRYIVVKLSHEQLDDEERWQDLFRKKVGTHWDNGAPPPEVKPTQGHSEFYEAFAKRLQPDYSNNPIVGWFQMN